jgi:hypothetical protein
MGNKAKAEVSRISRSENMRRIRSKDTGPELTVRRLLRSLGFTGYRLHRKDLPGKPDIAALIRKRDTGNVATAIPAISATQPKGEAATVARIATVAVANPKEEKTAPPAKVGAGMGAAQNDALDLQGLLALHGGFPGIDWAGLALIDAAQSDLWIVQRPDGLLTLLATVKPISKPASYAAAWPARFTTPEPVEDTTAPAAEAAQATIEKARQVCWDCKHLDTALRPSCGAGHTVVWMAQTRTYPRRADRIDPCPDQQRKNHET